MPRPQSDDPPMWLTDEQFSNCLTRWTIVGIAQRPLRPWRTLREASSKFPAKLGFASPTPTGLQLGDVARQTNMKIITAALLCVSALVAGLAVSGCASKVSTQSKMKPMKLEQSQFGQTQDGTPVQIYTLTAPNGAYVKITEFGAIITEIHVPDRNGKLGNVVLGFDNLPSYLKGHPFFGAIAGRVANRIANGKFTLDGKEYTLAVNNGPNHLHGGQVGFDKKVWNSRPLILNNDDVAVEFTCFSSDGDEGYPGNVSITVLYTFTTKNELRIDYSAKTDKATPINLTNHSYFNLAGSGNILEQVLMINASQYTPTDDTLIPTGKIAPVKGTPLDFTTPTAIGARIEKTGLKPTGYDHNFVLNHDAKSPAFCARALDPASGRVMEVFTTEPGVQLYTANHLDGTIVGTGGVKYPRFGAFCLETQHFPDSINHTNFPSVVLRPLQTFNSATIFKFAAR